MEYKFRGKRKDTWEWVYGFYWEMNDENNVNKPCITVSVPGSDDFRNYEIIPETVGMWSGWNDKNGNAIYQDDMLRGIMHEQDRDNNMDRTEQVMFDRGGFTVFNKAMQNGRGTGKGVLDCFMWFDPGSNGHRDQYWQIDNIEVIGNIHELTPAKGAVNYNMNNNIDPNAPKEQESAGAAAEAQTANEGNEQATQESAEEGGAEG